MFFHYYSQIVFTERKSLLNESFSRGKVFTEKLFIKYVNKERERERASGSFQVRLGQVRVAEDHQEEGETVWDIFCAKKFFIYLLVQTSTPLGSGWGVVKALSPPRRHEPGRGGVGKKRVEVEEGDGIEEGSRERKGQY